MRRRRQTATRHETHVTTGWTDEINVIEREESASGLTDLRNYRTGAMLHAGKPDGILRAMAAPRCNAKRGNAFPRSRGRPTTSDGGHRLGRSPSSSRPTSIKGPSWASAVRQFAGPIE